MSLEFYPRGTVDFSQSGTPIADAYNIAVHERISAAWLVSFDLPIVSDMREGLVKGAIVRAAGQLFRIGTVTEGISNGLPYARINGLHLFWEICSKIHLPRTMWIGRPANEILEAAFDGIYYGENKIRMLTPEELEARGMEPVTERTDIYRDRVTPLEVAARSRDHVGGEFYVDNFTFALVRRMGTDTNEVYNLNLQTTGIERMVDDGHTFTRLFPYGRNSLEITSVAGVNYIDSPHIGDDPEFPHGRQGQKEFSDFTRPAELLRAARWQFSPDNYWRIDRPRVTYSLSAVDLWKLNPESALRPQMGDSVRLIDPNLGIDEQVRVVAMEVYPYEPRATVYTLGDPPRTAGEVLAAVDPVNQFFIFPQFNLNLDDLLEGIIDLLPEFTTAGIASYFAHFDRLETNFDASLFLLAGDGQPTHDPVYEKRLFQRIIDQKTEYIEHTLQESRTPYTTEPSWWDNEPDDWDGYWIPEWGDEPDDWDGSWQGWPYDFVPETWANIVDIMQYRGSPVYWTVLPAHAGTRMTLTDPVLFNPPEYPPRPDNFPADEDWPTPEVIAETNAAHRFAHAVKLRKVVSEKITATVEKGEGTLPIWRRFPAETDEPQEDLPPGVYNKSQLKRVEFLRYSQWVQMVEDDEIDPDVFYMFPFEELPVKPEVTP